MKTKKFDDLYTRRFDRWIERLGTMVLRETQPLELEFGWSKDPVRFDDRGTLEFKAAKEGVAWGKTWESAWFHVRGSVPAEWAGRKVVAHLDFSGEGLVLRPDGTVMQGITNGSVFMNDFSRDIVPLFGVASGGEEVDLWVETAANGLFGMYTEQDPTEDSPNRYGHFDATVQKACLGVFDDEMWGLWLDAQTLRGLLKRLPEKGVRHARILHCVNEAMDAFHSVDNAPSCREILKRELSKPAASSDLSVLAVGHAHIDTAWLWPVAETVRKCARTFASQLALIERYPGYVFGASQPQHYEFVKDTYPELFERIREAVAAGSWEPQGGMWVEADCNVISGESMVRQILFGKNFFMDEFGVDVDNLWLPDVFGYSAALPQILRKSGIDSFLTQKISWNQFNEFPYHTFNWRGIDGTEILSHFPPENTYNSQLNTEYLVPAQEGFKERAFLDEFISLFGVGDGGGGPKEENIEFGKRMESLEGAPKVRFGTAKAFFDRLHERSDELPKWVGELYLELHRGTLTTQAKVKWANRRLEQNLRVAEMLWAAADLEAYPQVRFEEIWKKVLINQFHDIIPGSSIHRTYEVTHEEHEWALSEVDSLIQEAAEILFEEKSDSLVVFNPHPFDVTTTCEIPVGWRGFEVLDENGDAVPVQDEEEGPVAAVELPGMRFTTLQKGGRNAGQQASDGGFILNNGLVRYVFDASGHLVEAWDYEANRSVLEDGKAGNLLTIYEDRPNDWDAWDVDVFYENQVVETLKADEAKALSGGDVRQSLEFRYTFGKSTVWQTIRLEKGSKRLDFETVVDWHEKHRMLRVAFPVNVRAEQASFDIQYGYVRRNTHRNTQWDAAKFEVVAHKYVDLSDLDFGVALLNDSKYGHKVLENQLDLNILRAPTYPDPDADQGVHELTFSLLPHVGSLPESSVIEEATLLNRKPMLFVNAGMRRQLPWQVVSDSVSVEALKRAEKDGDTIVRLVENRGKRGVATLELEEECALVETNLMEWTDGEERPASLAHEIELLPFEIKTFRIRGA